MSFDTFVHWTQGFLALLIALLTAIPAALGALRAWADWKKAKSPPPPSAPIPPQSQSERLRRRSRVTSVISALLAIVPITILVVYLKSPKIEITEPRDGGSVSVILENNGSAQLRVQGTATRVAPDSKRRIYLLVHPEDPPAPGWWIQPEVSFLDPGHWQGVAWFGTRGWEAKPGQRLWIQAVVAARRDPLPIGKDRIAWVADPSLLDPATTSNVVRASVASVTRR
jgi:hypothetical protein